MRYSAQEWAARAACTAVAGALALLVVGCSGAGDGATGTSTSGFTASLTAAHGENRERAREIARLTEAAHGQGLERTLEIYAAIAEEAQAGRDRYAALRVPAPVAPEMAQVLRLLTDQVEVLGDLAPVARSGDRVRTAQAVARLAQLGTELASARQQLDAALHRCGQDCA